MNRPLAAPGRTPTLPARFVTGAVTAGLLIGASVSLTLVSCSQPENGGGPTGVSELADTGKDDATKTGGRGRTDSRRPELERAQNKPAGEAKSRYDAETVASKAPAQTVAPSASAANRRSRFKREAEKLYKGKASNVRAVTRDAQNRPQDGRAGAEVDRNGHDREAYDAIVENDFSRTDTEALSTFSIDVDTASYSNVRRILKGGSLPAAGAVRIEELLNYFEYDYPKPGNGEVPFSTFVEAAPCPWNGEHRLVHLGLRGKAVDAENLPPRNLVFLLDVSGSMRSANKLPLLKSAFEVLVQQLNEDDSVAIVVYAGASGLVLPATHGDDKQRILEAMRNLRAGGSTNGGAGIRLAYRIAKENFQKDAINRVILATDGDFNVGTTNRSELTSLIEKEREGGVFLTVLGLGTGNLQDATMEMLADKGNGNYAYLDSIEEAKKVLGHQAGGTLITIAKDVKIQVEFNPRLVKAYRLIGYENRKLAARDFADDKKDAGEIGAGHSVTALYEIVPVGAKTKLAEAPK